MIQMNDEGQVIGRYVMYSALENMKPFDSGLFVHNPGEPLERSGLFPQNEANELPSDFLEAIKYVTVELYSDPPRKILNRDILCITEYSPLENVCQLCEAINQKKHNLK